MEKVGKALVGLDVKADGVEDLAKIKVAEVAIEHFRANHSRALACHCECLGMNAENCIASCKGNTKVPFNIDAYKKAMFEWGLTDKEGHPTI